MKFISSYFKNGKIGTWTLVYLPFAVIVIIAALNTSSSGPLNFAGWVAGLLGIIVCFPWFYIGIEIIKKFGLRPNDYITVIFIISILINFLIMYNVDGKKHRLREKEKHENKCHANK
jgi:membrane-bound ClpP family serine protease